MDGFRLTTDAQDFFTSYDEVFESFDSMGLQENLLRGIYAYGRCSFVLFYVIPEKSSILYIIEKDAEFILNVALKVLRSHPQSNRGELCLSVRDLT